MPIVSDSSAYTACTYWGSLWGQTCCSVMMAKSSSSLHLLLYFPHPGVTVNLGMILGWLEPPHAPKSKYPRIP